MDGIFECRATKSQVKEAIIDFLSSWYVSFSDKVMYDLCCGTGSVGFSILNKKKLKKLYLVDADISRLKLIINNKKYKDSVVIIKSDAAFIRNNTIFSHKADIVFIDPPYDNIIIDKILQNIVQQKLLNSGAIIILEMSKRYLLEYIPTNLKLIRVQIYGISKVVILQYFYI